MVSFGFEANKINKCIYHKFSGSKVIFQILYVDDILLVTSSMTMLKETKKFLSSIFQIKDLGEASYVLDIKIKRDHSHNSPSLSQ